MCLKGEGVEDGGKVGGCRGREDDGAEALGRYWKFPLTITPPFISCNSTNTPPIISSNSTNTPSIISSNSTNTPPIISSNSTNTPPIISCNSTNTPPIISSNSTNTPPIISCNSTNTPLHSPTWYFCISEAIVRLPFPIVTNPMSYWLL